MGKNPIDRGRAEQAPGDVEFELHHLIERDSDAAANPSRHLVDQASSKLKRAQLPLGQGVIELL